MSMSNDDLRAELLGEVKSMLLPAKVAQTSEVVITIIVPADEEESVQSSYVVRIASAHRFSGERWSC